MSEKYKVLIIGIDGADWKIIDRYINYLPTFRYLINNGSYGQLKSTIPPLTPPAWTSITTGKNPGKHNVFDFVKITIDRESNSIEKHIVTSRDKRSPELWDYIPESISLNVPVTYPPKKIDGVMISGMMTPSLNSNFAYPSHLKKEIINGIPNYKFNVDWEIFMNDQSKLLDEVYEMTKAHIDLFWKLFKYNWNFFFFVIVGTDRLQHLLWNDNALKEYYMYIDNFLSDVIKEIKNKNIILLIVSDHGFHQVEKGICINRYLVESGLLKIKTSANRNLLDKLGITKDNIRKISKKINLYIYYKKMPIRIKKLINRTIPGKQNINIYDIDIDNSIALMEGAYGIYLLNRKKIFDVISLLKEIKDGNESVLEYILSKENIYNGPYVKNAPDIIIVPKEGYILIKGLKNEVIYSNINLKGDHRLYGIFIAYGPSVKPNYKLSKVTLYDIAPTVLHILNRWPTNTMDGTVQKNIFESYSGLYKKKVKVVDEVYYKINKIKKLI